MWKHDPHYLRITLVKPLCRPGLEEESLLRKDQIPCETVLAEGHKQQLFALCRVGSGTCEVSPPAPSFPACLAASAPPQTLAPVFYRKKFKSNLFPSSSFQKKPNPLLLILLKPWYRQVSLNTRAAPWPPPAVWHRSLSNTLDAVSLFPDPFATSLPRPTFLTYTSPFILPWVEDKLKYSPELKFQFTSWIWNQAEYQPSKTNLSGCWNNYFSSNMFCLFALSKAIWKIDKVFLERENLSQQHSSSSAAETGRDVNPVQPMADGTDSPCSSSCWL